MAELKLKIPDELEDEIKQNSDISWSGIFEKAAREKLAEKTKRKLVISALNKLLENSSISEDEAIELGKKVNVGMHKNLKEKGFL